MPEPDDRVKSALPPNTADWDGAAFDPEESKTRTHAPPPRSTSGPADYGHQTIGETTEPVPHDGSDDSELPNIPGYRVEEVVGRGGMGRVYRVVHLGMGRVEALKLITVEGKNEWRARERFEREVRTLAALDHPNVVPVYHAGHWMGFPYLTMKYIPGGALSRHLDRFAGNPEACARLMVRVARAVQALHEAGILHRDLKPLNVLLGENDEPLVADFGLARWLHDDTASDLTHTHIPVGTRAYMSPEQTLGCRAWYGVPCDVWAIGITLYELLSGKRPFADSPDGSSDLYDQIRTAEVPPLPPAIPAGLDAIVRRCLAKEPASRYPSAAAIAADLDRWLSGEPVEATSPISLPRPPRSFWRRYRVALGGLSAVLLVLLAALPFRPHSPPPPPPAKTAEERLAAGETIDLIGGSGLPLAPVTPIPGYDSLLSTHRDGYCTLTSIRDGAVELWNRPLPHAVRFEIEFAMTNNANLSAQVGAYVGRKETPSADGMHQTLIWFHYRETSAPGNPKPVFLGELSAMLEWGANGPITDHTNLTLKPPTIPINPPNTSTAPEWHRLSVTIDANRIDSTWGSQPLDPIFASGIHTLLTGLTRRFYPGGGLEFTPPMFGPGIGLAVRSGEAVYRHARLIPLISTSDTSGVRP